MWLVSGEVASSAGLRARVVSSGAGPLSFVSVDADELEQRSWHGRGWLREDIATLIAEHGYLDELHREAEAGDWHCAQCLARTLADGGRLPEALDVVAPFARTGWWRAVTLTAAILDALGRTAEAVALVEPVAFSVPADPAAPTALGGWAGRAGIVRRQAAVQLAELLCRQNRFDEAIALLGLDLEQTMSAEALVRLSAGRGRDEELATLLRARTGPELAQADGVVVGTLATVLERQGLGDEAVDLLTAHVPVGKTAIPDTDLHTEQLAGLLARLGRLDQLRDLLSRLPLDLEAQFAAEELAKLGRVDEAVELLTPARSFDAALCAATILDRVGRTDEAIAITAPVPRTFVHDDYLIRALSELLVARGRVDEALAALPGEPDSFEHATERCWILSHSGRAEQAVAELRARPDSATWHGRITLAELLAEAGRLDAAVETLQPTPDQGTEPLPLHLEGPLATVLAQLLVRQGRLEEAVAVGRVPTDGPARRG